MRTLTVTCETCGTTRDETRRAQEDPPRTWWLLEDHGDPMRTGPLDFCSLACLRRWLDHPPVREHYALDFEKG